MAEIKLQFLHKKLFRKNLQHFSNFEAFNLIPVLMSFQDNRLLLPRTVEGAFVTMRSMLSESTEEATRFIKSLDQATLLAVPALVEHGRILYTEGSTLHRRRLATIAMVMSLRGAKRSTGELTEEGLELIHSVELAIAEAGAAIAEWTQLLTKVCMLKYMINCQPCAQKCYLFASYCMF